MQDSPTHLSYIRYSFSCKIWHFQFKAEFLCGKIQFLGNVYHYQVHLLEKDNLVIKPLITVLGYNNYVKS
jgi:hypothetical protein